MSLDRIQDRIRWGLNVAARNIGATTDAYRPSCVVTPIAPCNRFLRLHAAFSGTDSRFLKPVGYGSAIWHGVFDAAYTQVGDYLVQNGNTWFIAAQQDLLPVLCVKADRVVSFTRSEAPSVTGINAYSGVTADTNVPLLTDWPASILGVGGSGQPTADLPSDQSVPYWTVLLPAYGNVVLLPADRMQDDLGRNATVAAAELTALGWRITVQQSSV
jgi:hypothetical protein